MKIHGKRPHGQVYITGGTENRHLHEAKYFDDKRYAVSHIHLDKASAEKDANWHRERGHLARIVPRMVWTNKAGYELGREKVQGYVVYRHFIDTANTKQLQLSPESIADLKYRRVQECHLLDKAIQREKCGLADKSEVRGIQAKIARINMKLGYDA